MSIVFISSSHDGKQASTPERIPDDECETNTRETIFLV